jgi:hypothetical protein
MHFLQKALSIGGTNIPQNNNVKVTNAAFDNESNLK